MGEYTFRRIAKTARPVKISERTGRIISRGGPAPRGVNAEPAKLEAWLAEEKEKRHKQGIPVRSAVNSF